MNKTEFSFKDKKGNRVKIEAEITTRNGYPEFTISGDYNQGCGQIVDRIDPANEAQERLISIWNKYHLNGMNAGTDAQNKILENCPDNDYDKRIEFLSYHTIEGKPITTLKYKQIDGALGLIKIEIEKLDLKINEVIAFKEEWLKAKVNAWSKSKFPDIIKIMRDNKFGNFIFTPSNESFVPDNCRFFKEGYDSRSKIPAKYRRRLDAHDEELRIKWEELNKEKSILCFSYALYDKHPKTGEPYKYGTAWLNKDLPKDFWFDFEILRDEIIEIEKEEREGELMIDINELEEENPLALLIEENAEDVNCAALALHLKMTVAELEDVTKREYGYGDCFYTAEGQDYYCGTWDEIMEAVKDYVENSAWVFNSEFLESQTGIPAMAFTAMQGECEGANDGVVACIEKTCGMEEFVKTAENEDGWAHFLNGYDGIGNEIEYNKEKYYICRT